MNDKKLLCRVVLTGSVETSHSWSRHVLSEYYDDEFLSCAVVAGRRLSYHV